MSTARRWSGASRGLTRASWRRVPIGQRLRECHFPADQQGARWAVQSLRPFWASGQHRPTMDSSGESPRAEVGMSVSGAASLSAAKSPLWTGPDIQSVTHWNVRAAVMVLLPHQKPLRPLMVVDNPRPSIPFEVSMRQFSCATRAETMPEPSPPDAPLPATSPRPSSATVSLHWWPST